MGKLAYEMEISISQLISTVSLLQMKINICQLTFGVTLALTCGGAVANLFFLFHFNLTHLTNVIRLAAATFRLLLAHTHNLKTIRIWLFLVEASPESNSRKNGNFIWFDSILIEINQFSSFLLSFFRREMRRRLCKTIKRYLYLWRSFSLYIFVCLHLQDNVGSVASSEGSRNWWQRSSTVSGLRMYGRVEMWKMAFGNYPGNFEESFTNTKWCEWLFCNGNSSEWN